MQEEKAVETLPPQFEKWMDDNGERIARAKSVPYFLKDNQAIIENKKPLSTGFGDDAYSVERKRKAIWDTGNGNVADDALHGVAGKQWRNATDLEKDKVYEYTLNYEYVNLPLQGRHCSESQTRKEFLERADNITSYIGKNKLPCDMWFTRGDTDLDVIASRIKFAGGEMPADLEDLTGITMQEGGFMSTACRKGEGFSSRKVIIQKGLKLRI